MTSAVALAGKGVDDSSDSRFFASIAPRVSIVAVTACTETAGGRAQPVRSRRSVRVQVSVDSCSGERSVSTACMLGP
ncbi:hypothetical protein C8D87_103431 [Lentzea atacamensis]|uniref:Uncharacterized protein n=1 Tax=Lentzea atacamensis TaxID=531938 RepID=A0ABX9EA96_9PSEU|nr:hypothetical protein [Lentzea atacamensis]RAS67092.1 hypothetical protein C8D87_103431 [Lentzea atacamensis]